MKLIIEKPVTIITPTIGTESLLDAVLSVKKQTYGCKHLLVVDGPEYYDRVVNMCGSDGCEIVVTPENTGANGFYGHRIYAAYPHLINSDYIFFLDEDNWYDSNHVRSLVDVLERGNDFAYSLRKIYTKTGEYIADDCCESLGKWPIFWSLSQNRSPEYLIDTSSYAFRREFLIHVSHHWHHGWGGDRRFYNILKQNYKANHDTSGFHTLNYRLDDNIEKKYGSIDFFIKGNDIVKHHYLGKYPWIS